MVVYDAREVELFGKRFPLFGPIRRTLSTPFAGKMTIGDYSRDDQVATSSWVLSSFSGGLGVQYASMPRDQDRYRFGTLDPRYSRQLSLAPQVHKVSDVGPAETIIDYNQRLFFTAGLRIYVWNENDGSVTAVGPTLSAPGRGISIYFGKMYILTLNELVEHDITAGTWNTYPVGGIALVGWDDKLFRLQMNNEIYWTIDPASPSTPDNQTWEYGGQVPLPAGYCNQLVIYFDVMQEPVIYAISRVGAWAYDFDGQRFLKTALTYPPLAAAGKGAAEWRGELRVPAGGEGYLFNNNVVQAVGPNSDDGLPEAYRGNIEQFIPGHAFYYCTIAVPEEQEEAGDVYRRVMPIETSVYNNDTFMDISLNRGAVLLSPGAAWHVVYLSDNIGARMGAGIVADIQNTHRLWFSTGEGLFWVDAPTSLHNPLQIPTSTYKRTGYLETPWFDAGWQEIPKLALSLEVFAREVDDENYIEFYIAWDEDETWELLGRVNRVGRASLNIGGSEGRLFTSCKLRIEMRRGENSTKTPVMRNGIFTFTRQPRKLWGWQMQFRIAEDFNGRTANDMYRDLMEIANAQEAGLLTFESDSGDEINTRVLVSDVNAAHGTGDDKRGQFVVSVIEMDPQPFS